MSVIAALEASCAEYPLDSIRRRTGVYLLICAGAIIYVGSSLDVDSRIASHWYRRDPQDTVKEFDRVLWIEVAPCDLRAYEGALIRRFAPALNFSSPAPCGRDSEVLSALGLDDHDETAAAASFNQSRRRSLTSPVPGVVGSRIRLRRISAGLTQQNVADAIGCTEEAVNHWESGRTSPSAKNMLRVCKLLSITPAELIQEAA